MDQSQAEFKRKLLDTGLFRKVSGDGQYVCKTCPFCGDTKSHMYVLIKQMDDTPVLYNCFKCNAKGVVNEQFISYFGIDDIPIPKIKGRRKIQPSGVSVALVDLLNLETDAGMIGTASEYLMKRVGVRPSVDDLKAFQLIGNPEDYVTAYLGGDTKGLKDRVWFRLSNGNMIGRSVIDDCRNRWKQRNYVGQRSDGMNGSGVYVIKRPLDTHQTINVCICEGVMDAVGLYYHGNISNPVLIGCMGRDYVKGLKYVIDLGIFGDSVNIRVYKDADVDHVRIPKQYSQLFKSISVYQNAIGKDYGVPGDQIQIEKCL